MKKQTPKLLALAFVFALFASCSENDSPVEEQVLEIQTITNLEAPQSSDYSTDPPTITGDYIKFSFEAGTVVTGEDWDIAFRGTTILVNGGEATAEDQPERTGNGGAYLETGLLAEIKTASETGLRQDSTDTGLAISTGSGNGWYTYDPANHTINPIAGKIVMVRTHDGKFAKMEILSYYSDGAPNENFTNSQTYSFNYVFQPDGSNAF